MNTLFPAVVDRAADGTYGVVFPDVAGCTSAGATLEEAVTMAEEALAQHLEVMAEEGIALPTPSELTAVAEGRYPGTAALILVPARMPAKVVRINVTMEDALIERIDAVSPNRSAFLADAARNELERRLGGGFLIPVAVKKLAAGKTKMKAPRSASGLVKRKRMVRTRAAKEKMHKT